MTAVIQSERRVPQDAAAPKKSFVLLVASILAFVVGFGSLAGGIFGAWYTWDQAVAQDVVTSEDAVIAETPVRGPFTMWAQSDVINHHQLERTGGLYYAQMDRQVPMVDDTGAVVTDESGETVMVPNEARASWMDAITLTTVLGLGVLSYAVAAFAIVVGITLIISGLAFYHIRSKSLLI